METTTAASARPVESKADPGRASDAGVKTAADVPPPPDVPPPNRSQQPNGDTWSVDENGSMAQPSQADFEQFCAWWRSRQSAESQEGTVSLFKGGDSSSRPRRSPGKQDRASVNAGEFPQLQKESRDDKESRRVKEPQDAKECHDDTGRGRQKEPPRAQNRRDEPERPTPPRRDDSTYYGKHDKSRSGDRKVKSTPPSGPSDPVDSEGDDDDDDTFSSSCPPMESDSVKTSEVKSMLRRWNSRRDQRNLWVPFALKTSMVIVGSTLAGDG